ncbi:MAG: hypothetical protein J6Q14_05835 [Oscillospiraceae bacterium]|nr:hypothetical protein [Oscillospiraceae bacterium]
MQRQEIQLDGGGTLTFWEDGALVVLDARREADGRGLYKVWLCGRERLLLGTLAPEGGVLRLRRRVYRRELERKGCWPVTAGECVLAFSFRSGAEEWRREASPARLVCEELKCCFAQCTALYRVETEGFSLALPIDPSRPFPIPTLFCLAVPGRVEGRNHVMFRFDPNGIPILPHKPKDTGEHSNRF